MKEIVSTKREKLTKLLLEEGFSYSAVQKALRKRDIKVNGNRVSADTEIEIGDKITAYAEVSAKKYCETLCEDDNVLIVYKYGGVTSDEVFSFLSTKELYYIHRLDRNTDGVMIFAKNRAAEEELLKGFKNRTFEKYYIAEVFGKMPKSEDTLTDYLLKDEKNSEVKIFKTPVKGSVKIITKYRVLEERPETSLLEVELVTGKTHQIRAHLASCGHFIIGDGKYGKESVNRRMGAGRQRLTAYKLVLHFGSGALKYLDGKTTEIDYATGRIHP